MFRGLPSVVLLAAVVGLPGCEPEHRHSETCSIELVDTGWHLDWEMPPEPRQNDAVGASYGVFAVSLPERTSDEVRERAAVLMSIISGREVSASDVTESSQPVAPSFRRFTSPGFSAEWEPESDYLEVFSNEHWRSDYLNPPPVGEAEAYRRFRCALVQLEDRSLLARHTVPPEGAALSRLISATLQNGEISHVRVEEYRFRSNRIVDGVIEPYSPVVVRVDASGALRSIGLATPTILSDGPPGKATPVAPGFTITRALSNGEIQARFRAEAEAVHPGRNVILSATGFEFRKRPMEFGPAIVPMQWFQFFHEEIASRGGSIWSYRIDDPSAARWDELAEP